ncbi:MAG: glycoside hydrolase family 127 protein [Clostridia bacterium]|nr:glycoside hydrolase family 127 protein [Clostridia bacterium]
MNKWDFYTAKEIKPKGWLKRQLEIQAEGLSGNLDKIWPDIRDSAWIGGDKEGWERVPYWLDGFIPLAYLLENEDMVSRAKKYIDAIVSSQKDSGWICPCDEDKIKTYDTWAVQLISKVLVVYYECSGDERIPLVVYDILKNYYELLKNGSIELFSWGKFRWFETFIAIQFTYKRYKEDWLKELAKILREQGADYNDFVEMWKRPVNHWKLETHIVNIAMMLKSEAVSCDILDKPYTDNADYLRSVLDQYNGTVYESFTGDECLSGLSAIQGTELCAIVEQMYSYELLYAYTGDRKWAERLEVLAFNALPATLSEDMWTHQYVQMSNQISCQKFHGNPIFGTNATEAHLFGLEPNYGCCTANFNQGWPKFALSAFMHNDNTIINSMMIPSELHADGVHIILETEYPFKNRAKYKIASDKDFTFIVRVPSFAENVKINGNTCEGSDLRFDVKSGESEILVEFETVPYFEKRPHGLNAVKCGTLIFSLPIQYTTKMHEYVRDCVIHKYPYCDYELIPQSAWNYGFSSEDVSVITNGVSDIPFSANNPPVVIKAKLQQIDWGYEERYDTVCAKIPISTEPISDEKQMELIPYGCAKLRITELPLLKK